MRKAFDIVLVAAILPAACDDGIAVDDSNYNLVVHESGSRGPASPATRAVEPSFTIGTTRQEVFDTLGDPEKIFYGDIYYTPGIDYDADAYHVFLEVGLSFRIFGDTVREITLLSSDWMASNGLIVGMTKAKMLKILWNDHEIQAFELKDFYNYDQYAIMVEVYHEGDIVGEINILEGNEEEDGLPQ